MTSSLPPLFPCLFLFFKTGALNRSQNKLWLGILIVCTLILLRGCTVAFPHSLLRLPFHHYRPFFDAIPSTNTISSRPVFCPVSPLASVFQTQVDVEFSKNERCFLSATIRSRRSYRLLFVFLPPRMPDPYPGLSSSSCPPHARDLPLTTIRRLWMHRAYCLIFIRGPLIWRGLSSTA